MSTRTVTIEAEGVGSIPKYSETDKPNYTAVEIAGQTFELWRLCRSDDYISWEEHVLSDDFSIISDILIGMLPETVFLISSYCHDGYGFSAKCGIFDGKYEEWDVEEYSVFEDFDDAFEDADEMTEQEMNEIFRCRHDTEETGGNN